jgi:hypothetical protein
MGVSCPGSRRASVPKRWIQPGVREDPLVIHPLAQSQGRVMVSGPVARMVPCSVTSIHGITTSGHGASMGRGSPETGNGSMMESLHAGMDAAMKSRSTSAGVALIVKPKDVCSVGMTMMESVLMSLEQPK